MRPVKASGKVPRRQKPDIDKEVTVPSLQETPDQDPEQKSVSFQVKSAFEEGQLLFQGMPTVLSYVSELFRAMRARYCGS